MIKIKLHLSLIKFVNKQMIEMPATDSGTYLKNLIKDIGIPNDEIGLIIKNGKWDTIECKLEDNDIIELFPYLMGG